MKPGRDETDDNVLTGLDRAPEVFVEGYRGVLVRGGVVKLNFFSSRFDPGLNRVSKDAAVVLAVPAEDLVEIAEALQMLVTTLRDSGALPSSGPEPGAKP